MPIPVQVVKLESIEVSMMANVSVIKVTMKTLTYYANFAL